MINFFKTKSINSIIDFNRCSYSQKVVLSVLLILTTFSIVKSFHDSIKYNGIDLRPKITGARAIVEGLDPYNYNWNDSMSEKLLDPKEGHPPGPSRSTYSPSLLTFYIPLSFLPYKIIRHLWWAVEWILMFSSIGLLCSIIKDKNKKFYFLSISLFFFCSSYMWRLHLERGQYYVILIFILSLIIVYLKEWQKYRKRIGFFLGFLVSLRITYLPIILYMIIFKKFKIAFSAIITFLSIVIFTSLISGSNIWQSYLNNINEWEQILVDPSNRSAHEWKSSYPVNAEGLNFRNFLERKSYNESLWLRLKNDFKIVYDYDINNYIIILLNLIFILIAFFKSKKSDFMLVFLLMLFFINMFSFLGPQRHLYTNIIFLPMIAIFIEKNTNFYCLVILLTGLIFGHPLIPVNTALIPTYSKNIFFFFSVGFLLSEYFFNKEEKNYI